MKNEMLAVELENVKNTFCMAKAANETASSSLDEEMKQHRHLLNTDEEEYFRLYELTETKFATEFFYSAYSEAETLVVDFAEKLTRALGRKEPEITGLFEIARGQGWKSISATKKIIDLVMKLNLKKA